MSAAGAVSWRDLAACVGKPVDWFYERSLLHRGRRLCASCPVASECRAEHAQLERDLHRPLPGLWGGKVDVDRPKMPRQAVRQATPQSCVVCGSAIHDRGQGAVPKFCDGATGPCAERARYRRRRGLPESDAAFTAWKADRAKRTLSPQVVHNESRGSWPSDPQASRGQITARGFDPEVA